MPLDDLYTGQLADARGEPAARFGRRVLAGYAWAMLRSRSHLAFRRRLGAAARRHPGGEGQRTAVIAARLPAHTWPQRPLRIIDAVAASCAVPLVWPPVTIGGRRYMDGGMRSATNADLAAGYERVVVLAPLPRGAGWLPAAAAPAAELRRGAQVVVVSPDAAARAAIGRNVLDPARRAAAARAGLAQAAGAADAVRQVWLAAPVG